MCHYRKILILFIINLMFGILYTNTSVAETVHVCDRFDLSTTGFTSKTTAESWYPKRVTIKTDLKNENAFLGKYKSKIYKKSDGTRLDLKFKLRSSAGHIRFLMVYFLPIGEVHLELKPRAGFTDIVGVSKYKCTNWPFTNKNLKIANNQFKAQNNNSKGNINTLATHKITSSVLCVYAQEKNEKGYLTGRWSKYPNDFKYVMEAKRRGLSCGIKNDVSTKSNDPIKRPLASVSDTSVCYNATIKTNGFKVWNYRNNNFVGEANFRGLDCGVQEQSKIVLETKPKNTKSSVSFVELEKERAKRLKEELKRKALEQRIAELEKKNKELQEPKKIKHTLSNEIGSGFYVSKFRHVVTNHHVVNGCKKITVGDSISKQIPATLVASDSRNDLAILQTISMEMASADTKTFIQNLSIEIVPIVSAGLIRAEDVIGGEEIFVAGYPLGSMVSDSMRLISGLVNATKGYENDITQFETDASIKKGNSGGPIYDKRGNIVGVAVKRLNINQSDNYNFAIKGTTVKQFLDANGVLTSFASRKLQMSSTEIYKIASKQTIMVVCHR